MKKYNILITNVYSWYNKGDATIVLAMIENLKKYIPINHIGISTIDNQDFLKYGSDYRYYESLQNYSFNKKNIFLKKLIKTLFLGTRIIIWGVLLRYFNINSARIFFSSHLLEKINSYQKYDIIITCGGGYTGTNSIFSIFTKSLFLSDFLIAFFYRKKIFLYSQSFGPLGHNFHGRIYAFLFKNIELLQCREKISYDLAKSYGIKNIALTGDIAFCLGDGSMKKNPKLSGEIKIGVTARKWFKERVKQEKYESELAHFIDNLISKNQDIRVYFIPQVIFRDFGDNDLVCYDKIYTKIYNKNNLEIITEDLSPYELKYLIGQCDYFIGTRMHSNILALSSGVKTIAIAYEHKTNGIMEDLGLSDYCINIEDTSSDLLDSLFSKISNDSTYLHTLAINLETYKKRADSAGYLIKEKLGC